MRGADMDTDKLNKLMKQSNTIIIIIKFTAGWCKPCRIISPMFEEYILKYFDRDDVMVGEVDIDTSEFYKELKRKRMINGIPCIMAFYKKDDNYQYLIPDDSITGANIQDVSLFLNRCNTYIINHTK